ncbi:acyl CoA binding protein-domain-containing protein [Dichotomocladium elegans]|nr:acyl CoA binding protein-domain-containing protein [Dichotomocladium elegans]
MPISTVSYTTQIQFCRALNVVRSLSDHDALQPTAADKLNLYGLYKQATQGDCVMPRPSSRQMGRYAKWKAWDQRQGISPVEAQRLYVNTLIELLVEFINRYPDHEQTPYFREALCFIEMKIDPAPDAEDLYVDAWDPEETEKEEYYLAHLGPHQLESSDLSLSPEQQQQQCYESYPTPSLATFASNPSTHRNFPDTPDLSPPYHHHQPHKKTHQGSIGSISISNYPATAKRNRYVRPNDFLNDAAGMSDTETADREVAATTASLCITSPTSYPPTYPHSERALESLQTEVTALAEQLDMVRKSMAERDKRDRRLRSWSAWGLIKTVAKHTFINSLVLLLVFLILWRRRSPLALIAVDYMGPKTKDLMRYLLQHVVFWKVTV